MTVAHRLVPRTRFEDRLRASASDIARVGLCLLGLWFLMKYAASLVSLLVRAFLVTGEAPLFGSMDGEQRRGLAILIVETVIALLLVLRAGPIATLLLREEAADGVGQEST